MSHISFADLERVLGRDEAFKLCERLGGTVLYIPSAKRIGPDHRLFRILGEAAVRRLVNSDLASGSLKLPTANAIRIAARNATIRKKKHAGLSSRELALEYRLDQRTIERIVAQHPGEAGGPQPDRPRRAE